jgi:hypothetical protein
MFSMDDKPHMKYFPYIVQSAQLVGYELDEHGSIPVKGNEVNFCTSALRPGRLWCPPIFLDNGYRGNEVHHSLPSSAEVKNASSTSTPHTSSWCGA